MYNQIYNSILFICTLMYKRKRKETTSDIFKWWLSMELLFHARMDILSTCQNQFIISINLVALRRISDLFSSFLNKYNSSFIFYIVSTMQKKHEEKMRWGIYYVRLIISQYVASNLPSRTEKEKEEDEKKVKRFLVRHFNYYTYNRLHFLFSVFFFSSYPDT